jgi:hypothetical protein
MWRLTWSNGVRGSGQPATAEEEDVGGTRYQTTTSGDKWDYLLCAVANCEMRKLARAL